MRRTNQEFKEELLHREAAHRARQAKRQKQLLTAALCAALVFGGVVLLEPLLPSAGSTENMTSQSVTFNGTDEAMKEDIREIGSLFDSENTGMEAMAVCPAVMIDGLLYFDTGYFSDEISEGDAYDGEITSQVDGSRIPEEDDQSNFGTGYGYRYGAAEGTVEVYMNGRWKIFAMETVRESIQFP